MRKGLKKRFIYSVVIGQIFLLISMSFALAFLISDNFVHAITPAVIPTGTLTTSTGLAAGSSSLLSVGDLATKGLYFSKPVDLGNFGYAWTDKGVTSIVPTGDPGIYNLMDAKGGIIDTADFTPSQLASFQQQAATQGALPAGWDSAHPIKSTLGGQAFGGGVTGSLIAGLGWAVIAYSAVAMLGGMFGLDKGAQQALSNAAAGGAFVAGTLNSFVTNHVGSFAGGANSGIEGFLGAHPYATGLVVAAAIFILTYKSESKKLVNFQCLPYEPPLGGSQCEQCNKDPFKPCSEYRCRSLGQACQLLNAGTAQEQCAWVSRNDVTSPTITPWTDALSPNGLKYLPDTAVRPPAIGTKIVTSTGGCLPAFTPLQFGITNNEPAQCKIDYNHTAKFDDMQYYVGGSNYYAYNHTEIMRLPGPDTGNNSISPLLQNNGQFSLYVRCRDANGNANVDEYAFSFCVDQGPDTTPPVIEGFSIPSGNYVGYNQDNVPIQVYVNEPSECKWSTDSKAYDDMENSLTCATQSYQVNANLQYVCTGNLTGVQNKKDNTFYFRCKDQPNKPDNERNVDVQSTPLVLKGSQPLVILSTSPNSTITGSTDAVPVNLQLETSAGANGDGTSTCSFSSTGQNDSYITMFQTGGYQHQQTLNLVGGGYTYYFRCIDAGGNAAESSTTFSVSVDKQAPIVTRVYKQDALKIVTNENAQCSYSLSSCNFNIDDGLKMIYSNPDIQNNLFAEWKPSSTYYIRCRDLYGNEPGPNQCSIVASAITLSAN